MKGIKNEFKKFLKILNLDEMKILPGQLAYFFILAIFSMIALVGLIGSSFITNEIRSAFESFPSAAKTLFNSLLDTEASGSKSIMFIIVGLYVSSNGAAAIIITSDMIYKIRAKNAIKRRIKAVLITIVLMTVMLFVVLVPAFGDLILRTIQTNFPFKIIDSILEIYHILKYPISFILIFVGIKIVYSIAPDSYIPSKYNNKGTLFTTILWVIVTRVYAIYLNNVDSYNIFYGSLANFIIVIMWIYILSYIFTMGMAINADTYNENLEKNIKV